MQSIVLRKPATVAAKLACNTVIARRMATAARERPLSPHLTIYKFRVNMITSVIFRGTGIALVGGLGALSIAYIPAGGQLKDYIWHLQQYPFLNALVKAGVVFPLTFHYMGGLRHLAWDNIQGQNLEFVRKTGWGAVAAASVFALIAMGTEFKGKSIKNEH